VLQVYAATNGFVDRITVERVPAFLADLVSAAHARYKQLREKIASGDWSDETQTAIHAAVSEFAEDFGYDLDEDGQPVAEDAPPERSPAADDGNHDDPQPEPAEEPEEEGGPA